MSQLMRFKKIQRETHPKHKKPEEKYKEKHREIGFTINVAYGVCLKETLN